MTSTVATETPQVPAPAKPLLETWGKNERMRHIAPIPWIVDKLDHDLRRRIELVCATFDRLGGAEAEPALNSLCRALDRIADLAKHARPPQHGGDLTARIREALQNATANLRTVDDNLFGRRYPFQTHERSKAEPMIGALLSVINALQRAVAILRNADPGLDEQLLDGLVTLQTPLRAEPIA